MELEKLKELFYSADKPNMKLSIELAKSMGHQPFVDFYNQWLEILKFYQSRGAKNYSLIDCVETFKERGNSIYIGDVKDANLLDCFRLLADDCLGITLANTTFETLPEVFQSFKQLKSAKFYKNCIKKIPNWFYELTDLETLIFENNPIWIMPAEFTKFKKLKELTFNHQMVSLVLPPQIVDLQQLESLNLGVNYVPQPKIKELSLILQLKKLKNLSLTYLDISDIQNQLHQLPALRSLSLSNCKIDGRQLNGSELRTLESLSITNCEINNWQITGADLSRLEHLEINNCNIDGLQIDDTELINLKTVTLEYMKLKALPSFVANSPNLEELYLRSIKIPGFSPDLAKLTKLTYADIRVYSLVYEDDEDWLPKLEKWLPNASINFDAY